MTEAIHHGDWMREEQDRRISDAVGREESRLRNFIRRRVADQEDAEDILQEVFYELVEAVRLMKPLEQVGAWLFRVARNRIIDRFRRKAPEPAVPASEARLLEELFPSPDAGPEEVYAYGVLLDELDAALGELPEEQRQVFIAHELEGRSFKELAAESGLNVNTLISRKHYAVLHLRRHLREIYEVFEE